MEQLIPARRLSTFRADGPDLAVITPPDAEAVCRVVDHCRRVGRAIVPIGRGSNTLLVNPPLLLSTANLLAVTVNYPRVRAEAGVPLQRLIGYASRADLGGIEYLWSVPGTVGGAAVMNAGRGTGFEQFCFGNRVVSVEVFDGHRLRTLTREECGYAHRKSDLGKYTVLAVTLELDPKPLAEVQQAIRDRTAWANSKQDSRPSVGSMFSLNYKHSRTVAGLRVGGAAMSDRSVNWMYNAGGATAADGARLMELVERDHADRGLPLPTREVVVL